MGKKARLREKTSDGTVVLDLMATYDEDGNRIKDTYSKAKYEHNIKLYRAGYGIIMFRIINNDSSQYNTYAKIATALYNAGYRLANGTADLAMASGVYSESSGATRIPTGVFSTNGSTISYYYVDIVYTSGSNATIYTNNMSGSRMSTTTVANHANLYTWDYVRTL